MPIEKICKACNKPFKVPPNREHTAHTCSQPCRGTYLEMIANEKRDVSNCLNCGKEIRIQSCRTLRGNGKYCSRSCKYKFQSGMSMKPQSHNGTEITHSDGYIYEVARNHPYVSKSIYVLQHRLRMEEQMRKETPDHHFLIEIDGIKYLKRNIHVHHKDEVKNNNSIENLIACTSSGHRDLHAGKVTMFGEVWPVPDDTIKAEARYVEASCDGCSTLFTIKRSTFLKTNKHYCTRLCYETNRADPRNCKMCGVDMTKKRNYPLFCSTDCYAKARVGKSPKHVFNEKSM